ncbi:hypothetical protein ACHAQJ_003558 [Trichoderma viride]
MPHLIELSEWRLLQRLAVQLGQRKASYQVLPGPVHYDAELLEIELRRAFMVQEFPQTLDQTEFEQCQEMLKNLCSLLDAIAWPPGAHGDLEGQGYTRLRALTGFLESTSGTVDLVYGPNKKLFRLPNDAAGLRKCLHVASECNNALSRLLASPLQEWATQPSQRQQKKRMWKKGRIRNRAKFVLTTLFEHFRCGTPHEVLLKIIEDPDEDLLLPNLQLMLSSCPELRSWQEVQCHSDYIGEASISSIPDICTDLQQHTGQGKALILLIQKYGLFGTWAGLTSSSIGPSTTESLDQLIKRGAFKPLDLEMLAHGASSEKTSIKDKRTLAVKLGYCLMDFFDTDLNSKNIYFLDSSISDPKKEFPYLALGSKLPATAESYSFQMGHPALLSFAKLLLEIDFGQSLELDISPHNNQNQAAWVQLLGYVDRLEEDRNDSYLEAIRGCLTVHHTIAKKLRSCDLDSSDADPRVREALFDNIVHKLEDGLSESIPRAPRKRQRSESPSTSDGRSGAQAVNSRERQRSESPASSDSQDEAQAANSREMAMHFVEPQRTLFEHKRRRISKLKRWFSNTGSRLARGEISGLFNDDTPEPEAMMGRHQPNCREDFQIALICALRVEFDAVEALFDDYYENDFSYGKARDDPNSYTTGRIGSHDVVLAFMPGMGKLNSANVAAGFRVSFPEIRLAIVVGVCGGVPNGADDKKEVLLGDVIISTALVQFDFGRRYDNKTVRRDTPQDNLGRPNPEIRSFLKKLSGLRGRKTLREMTSFYLEELWGKDGFEEYSYPGADNDKLYRPEYPHKHYNPDSCSICQDPNGDVCDAALESSCENLGCQDSMTISRVRIDKLKGITLTKEKLCELQKPLIHFGMIVSGDLVMKSGYHRDEIASREKAIAFEMEGAGVWDNFPTVVIKGVCDYADSHKNKTWQRYAAATAAACMKAFLGEWR